MMRLLLFGHPYYYNKFSFVGEIANPARQFLLKGNLGGKALKWLPAHFNFERRNPKN